MRIFTFVTGILMVAAAVLCFLKQGSTLLSVALLAGLAVLLLSACLGAVAFREAQKKNKKAQWPLAEAALDFLMGFVILLSSAASETGFSGTLGMWLLACAVLRLMPLLLLEKQKSKALYGQLGLAAFVIIAGFYCCLDPGWLSPVFLLGVAFAVQAALVVATGMELTPGSKMIERLKAARRRKEEEADCGKSHEE